MVAQSQTEPENDPVDVVIVGAGAAGSLFAAKLAAAGKRVRVLEAGPAWRSSDLYSSQVWSRRLKWGGPPVITTGEHRIAYHMNAGSGFGGAALHHYAVWPRLHPEDFRMRSLYGRGLDWPITYDVLRPYYDAIQEEVGIAGDAMAEVWRPSGAPYPMPPLRTFAQGRMLARGFTALGLRTAPTPLAINSVPYKGRPACLYEGWCEAGCPVGALANPLVTYLAEARRAGADVRSGCQVVRVVTTRNRATAVEYVDDGGTRRTQRAGVVLLCAAAVQNAWLLLNSAADAHPRGVANDSGLVGRYLMTHLLGGVSGMFADPTGNHLGVTGGQYISQDGYGKDRRAGPFGSYQWLIAPALKVNDLAGIANTRVDLFGDDLHAFLRRAATNLGSMGAMCESVPDEANRVELDGARDRFGQPLARLVHRFDADALGLFRLTAEEGRAIMKAAGATDVAAGAGFGTAHLMGGTVMGTESARSVTDSYGRAHTVGGLVLAGSGLFPTGGAVNPTFTINALALRTVRHMVEHWSEYAA